jgi:hypothetical protein
MKFCPACGAAQTVTTQARFCHSCGVSLFAFPPPTGLPALRAAPTTLNVGALVFGLLGIALVVGGLTFLGVR